MTHSFDVQIAEKYGVNAAIIFQNIYYWCEHNRANGRNEHDGMFWTYNSRKAFAELFPYLSERQIKTALDKLVEDGLIAVGCFNDDNRDRTLWYAVTKVGYCILQNRDLQMAEMSNANSENVRPLPDNKPQIENPDINERGARAQEPFSPPTVDEAQAYADSIGYTGFNAEAFVNHYAAKGWRSGGSPIVDWRAMVRVWRARDGQFTQPRAAPTNPALDYQQRDYNAEDWDAWFAESERRMAEICGGTG